MDVPELLEVHGLPPKGVNVEIPILFLMKAGRSFQYLAGMMTTSVLGT